MPMLPARMIETTMFTAAMIDPQITCKVTMFNPFMNIARGVLTLMATDDSPRASSRLNVGCTASPTHICTILLPNTTRISAGGALASQASFKERMSVRRTQLASPRAAASAYAGQSGLNAMYVKSGAMEKRRKGTAY